MAIKRIVQVKERKPFALWDILVYALLAAFVVLLFVIFVFTGNRSAMTGIAVTYYERRIYSYSFQEGEFIALGWENRIQTEREGDILLITIYQEDEKEHYNRIRLDLENKSAKMQDTNCSRGKDCLYFNEIRQANDVAIVCLPHRLVVQALNAVEDYSDPFLG